jgi:hypothetical protein
LILSQIKKYVSASTLFSFPFSIPHAILLLLFLTSAQVNVPTASGQRLHLLLRNSSHRPGPSTEHCKQYPLTIRGPPDPETAFTMSTTIIQNVLLFDGNRSRPDATVTFDSRSGKITAVSAGSDNAQHSSGATVIDGKGHTLLPGLIESHMHCHGMHLPEGASEADILRSPLRSGITTVCDMFSPLDAVNKLRTAAAKDLEQAKRGGGAVTMSDLKSCIVAATIAGGWPKPIILSGHPSAEVSAYPRSSGARLMTSRLSQWSTPYQT